MTMGEQIETLKERTKRLQDLLADPHPGLFTWVEAVGRAIDDVADLAPSYRKVER